MIDRILVQNNPVNWVDPWGLSPLGDYFSGTIEPTPFYTNEDFIRINGDGVEALARWERGQAFQNFVNESSEKVDNCHKKCIVPALLGESVSTSVAGAAKRTSIRVGFRLGSIGATGAGWLSTMNTLYLFDQCMRDCLGCK